MKNVLMISMPAIATTILAKRVKAAAHERQFAMELTVLSESEGMPCINEFDILLLPPHLRHLLNMRKGFGAEDGLIVKVIDSTIFGDLNGEAVLNIIQDSLL